MKSFNLTEGGIEAISEIVHDADLANEKHGRRVEGTTIASVLAGWDAQEIPDDEPLARGIQS